MLIPAFIASLALLWLFICFGLWVKEAKKSFREEPRTLMKPITALKTTVTSMWGQDFAGSAIMLGISTMCLPGVMGMLVGLFASGMFSAVMGIIHIKKNMLNKSILDYEKGA